MWKLFLVLFIWFLIYLWHSSLNLAEEIKNEPTVTVNEPKIDQPPASPWLYDELVDWMTGEKTRTATNYSTNKVWFAFPYEWWSYFTLNIIEVDWRTWIGFSVSKGHIASEHDYNARIKFDDWETFETEYFRSWNWNLDTIMFKQTDKILAWLKNSNSMKVEVWYYKSWSAIAEFNTHGFEW